MTTTTAAAPTFETQNHHAVVRVLTIIGLCTALAGGFLASSWRAPSASTVDDTSSVVRCSDSTTAQHC